MNELKQRLLVIGLFLIGVTYAQQHTFQLNWKPNKHLSFSYGSGITIHGFQSANFHYNPIAKTVRYVEEITGVRAPVDEQRFEISNIQYVSISAKSLEGYDLKKIPDDIQLTIKNTQARSNNGVYISFSPIIKTNAGFKKVRLIELVFQEQQQLKMANLVPTVTNSVMAQGQWFRFKIKESGVYKLDKSFFNSLGINTNDVNPQKIRIFGNGGRSIPEINAQVNYFDVQETAVKFIGESDGSLDDSDYLLFYAQGAKGWNVTNKSHINPYIDDTYYYVNISSSNGKRIQPLVESTGVSTITIDRFHEYQYHELDKVNVVRLGRKWYGESFQIEDTHQFIFDFSRRINGTPMAIRLNAMSAASNQTSMSIVLNDQMVYQHYFGALGPQSLGQEFYHNTMVSTPGTTIKADIKFNNNGNPSAVAHLDYIALEALSSLRGNGRQFEFANKEVPGWVGIGNYQISNATNISEVWDISNIHQVRAKMNNGSAMFEFKGALGAKKKYLAIDPSDYYVPQIVENGRVSNQNLKGSIFNNELGVYESLDYIIITPKEFYAAASRLATINKQQRGLRCKVVVLDEIYAEFNTGNQDIGAIRNFIRYVYTNGGNAPLKYVCLFGDGSFDYKDKVAIRHNFVPLYHALPSLNLLTSFVSDDFYGLMDVNEGSLGGYDKLDIAVGRMLVDSQEKANAMVDKVAQYYEKESYGDWRNRFAIVSDDVDKFWEGELQLGLNELADNLVEQKPFLNAIKIHTDAYVQEASAGGELYPRASQELINKMQLGVLMVNYYGHGGEDGLATERIFQKSDAAQLSNKNKYFLMATFTCEFSRFDNPFRTTAGEMTYWNRQGGAIALVTTTREINRILAKQMNDRFVHHLFDLDNTGYVSIAEALRKSKNEETSGSKRVVSYIGDPALKLAIPKPNIQLTKVNDIPVSSGQELVLKALDRVKLAGQVTGVNGAVVSDYNGILATTIYDKKQSYTTRGNDGVTDGNGSLLTMDFQTLGDIIYRGQATINNGLFEFEFVVPKDIAIPIGEGKISFYARRGGVLEDKTGVNTTIKIGGINADAPADNEPPKITAFMNDEGFVSGGVTNASPFLLLRLSDLNGINTASGIGHDITAILDGDESNPFVLNDYYETEPDDFTRGMVRFQFKDLASGLHTIRVKAWDVYNNSSTTEIQFLVVDENSELKLDRVLNYPNPFVNHTEFWFSHNSSSELETMVQIFTVTGRLIKTIKGNTQAGASLSRDLIWNGRDDFGEKVGKGVYVYKLSVKSLVTNKRATTFEKLVIL